MKDLMLLTTHEKIAIKFLYQAISNSANPNMKSAIIRPSCQFIQGIYLIELVSLCYMFFRFRALLKTYMYIDVYYL